MNSKYFVLKPSGTDAYARASRVAMYRYAHEIQKVDPKLACEIQEWCDHEGLKSVKKAGGLGLGECSIFMAESPRTPTGETVDFNPKLMGDDGNGHY